MKDEIKYDVQVFDNHIDDWCSMDVVQTKKRSERHGARL
jgi:hypothetical protein